MTCFSKSSNTKIWFSGVISVDLMNYSNMEMAVHVVFGLNTKSHATFCLHIQLLVIVKAVHMFTHKNIQATTNNRYAAHSVLSIK